MEKPHRRSHHAKPQDQRHQRHVGRQLKHLRRADGRRVYVAATPEEADDLRRSLSPTEPDAEYVVHASEEHLNTLRHVHSFHQQHKINLKKQHGEIFDELEASIREMDGVREDLRKLEDHVLELDEAAQKFGYDSHVRILDQKSSDARAGPQDMEAERRNASSMAFVVKPALRQYYHKGLLWRESAIQEVGSYELFVDLVYVGIIAIAGDTAVEESNGKSVLRFTVTFLIGWKFWSEISIYTSWFKQEDMMRRISVLFVLVCLIGFTVNMTGFFGDTYTAMVAFYVCACLMSSISFIYYSFSIPMIRITLISNAVLLGVSAILWIISIHVSSGARYALMWIGLFLDILGFQLKMGVIFWAHESQNGRVKEWFSKYFEYVPAISVEHVVSRSSTFVTLVLGYSVVSLLYQSASSNPMNNYFCKAALGLLQAFAVNSLYFEMDQFNMHKHALRRHNPFASFVWRIAHIPFTMAYVASGAALSRLVLAHDCRHCPIDALLESYAERSEDVVSINQRWFYCAGLGISVVCTAAIAGTHTYKTPKGDLLLRKSKMIRLCLRAVVGIVILLLPLARSLDSVSLIAVTMGLVHLCLFSDLAGNMMYNRHRKDSCTGLAII